LVKVGDPGGQSRGVLVQSDERRKGRLERVSRRSIAHRMREAESPRFDPKATTTCTGRESMRWSKVNGWIGWTQSKPSTSCML
jgi:hypothetical protein